MRVRRQNSDVSKYILVNLSPLKVTKAMEVLRLVGRAFVEGRSKYYAALGNKGLL